MTKLLVTLLCIFSSTTALAEDEIQAVGKFIAIDCKEIMVRVVRPKDKGFCVVVFDGTASSQINTPKGTLNKWVRVNRFLTIDPRLKLQDNLISTKDYTINISDSQITRFEAGK